MSGNQRKHQFYLIIYNVAFSLLKMKEKNKGAYPGS